MKGIVRVIISVAIGIIGIAFVGQGQNGRSAVIKGVVKSQDSASIELATVYLKNTSFGTYSGSDGFYFLRILPGKYTLCVQFIGYEPFEKEIEVGHDERKYVTIELKKNTVELENIDVVGKSVVQQLNQSAYNVVAIDAKGLYNTNETLTSALSKVSGVKIRESGGVGSNTQMTLDGFSGKQIKVFIDGIPQDGVGSSFGLNNIPINYADRIEVYKGVVPVGFGADALGGVVNIVTNNKRRTFLDAAYTYGSFNTHKSYLNMGHTTQYGILAELNIFQNFSDNNYYVDTPVKDFATGVWDTSIKEHVRRFNDSYHNEAVIGRVGLVGKSYADRLLLSLTYSQEYKEIQNGVLQEIVYGKKMRKGQSFMPAFEYKKLNLFATGLNTSLTLNYNKNLTHNVDTSAYRFNWRGGSKYNGSLGEQAYQDSEYDADNINGTFSTDYSIGEKQTIVFNHVLTAFDRKITEVPDASSGAAAAGLIPKKSRKNISGLSYRYGNKEVWNITGFGKYYSQFSSGPQNTSTSGFSYVESKSTVSDYGYGGAGSYMFVKNVQLKLSYEKALRLPSTDELFGDEDLEMGSVQIKPERSDNINLALSFRNVTGKHVIYLESGLIYRDTKDYIRRRIQSFSGGLNYATRENHGQVLTKGINFEGRYNYSNRFSFGGNFSGLDIRDNEKYVQGNSLQESTTYKVRMPNVPYMFANADASMHFHDMGGKGNVLSVAYDFAYVHEFPLYWENHGSSNKKRVPDQLSHDIGLIYSLKEGRYNVSVECKNLTDEQLYDNFSLQKPGRAFYAKVRYYFNKQ